MGICTWLCGTSAPHSWSLYYGSPCIPSHFPPPSWSHFLILVACGVDRTGTFNPEYRSENGSSEKPSYLADGTELINDKSRKGFARGSQLVPPTVLSLFGNCEEAPGPARPSPVQTPRGLRSQASLGPLCRGWFLGLGSGLSSSDPPSAGRGGTWLQRIHLLASQLLSSHWLGTECRTGCIFLGGQQSLG